jgi:hypothetical protein
MTGASKSPGCPRPGVDLIEMRNFTKGQAAIRFGAGGGPRLKQAGVVAREGGNEGRRASLDELRSRPPSTTPFGGVAGGETSTAAAAALPSGAIVPRAGKDCVPASAQHGHGSSRSLAFEGLWRHVIQHRPCSRCLPEPRVNFEMRDRDVSN